MDNSQDIYKELLLGLNKANNQTKEKAAQIKQNFNLEKNQKKRTWFLNLFRTKKEMMRQAFLPFLSFKEILNMSLLSKEMNQLIDPNRGQENPKSTVHLKMIAACHLLPEYQTLSFEQIDTYFGVDVQQISDFQCLDGTIFKIIFLNFMSEAPQIENFKFDFP